MEKVPMTTTGHARMEEELRILKTQERPAVIRAIAEAREHGDLSENAEYHAAREKQSFIEGRIEELEDKLSRADVIDVSKMSGTQIKFGATVVLEDENSGETVRYQLVGPDEGDIKKGLIAVSAPLAKALINKTVGDRAEVHTPKGVKAYEIMKVLWE